MASEAFTREEQYLKAIAEGSTSVPIPKTRIEQYLEIIAKNQSSGGTIDAETAYQMAVEEGYTGTKTEWIESISSIEVPLTNIDFGSEVVINAN